jgi:hypothetical protein
MEEAMTETATGTRKHLNLAQQVKLVDLLRQHCSSVDGCAVYHDGWDDMHILFEMGDGCGLSSVKHTRRTLMGELRKPTGSPTLDDLARRVEALEQWARRSDPTFTNGGSPDLFNGGSHK